MKKNLISLLTVAVVLVSAANVASASNPVSNWLNRTANSIEKVNSDVNKTTAQAEADRQSFLDRWKAKRQEAKARREAKEATVNKEIKETKNAFQRLFTWDWE